jgi:uncharacterized membrane protein
MPYCPNCGAKAEARFCAQCGSAVQVAPPVEPAPEQPTLETPAPPPAYRAPASRPLADNVAAALCYVLGPITGILFLTMEPYRRNPNIRFHAWQSSFLAVAGFVAVSVVNAILGGFLVAVSLGFLASMLSVLMTLAVLAIWVYMLAVAYQGKTVVLPIIGPWARKQA